MITIVSIIGNGIEAFGIKKDFDDEKRKDF